jgi:hypothetical protein
MMAVRAGSIDHRDRIRGDRGFPSVRRYAIAHAFAGGFIAF